MKRSLAQRVNEGGYDGYAYAYPHKTAYRPLDPPVSLADAWQFEDKQNLFLYVHLPFCEMRCGFCNLFTTVQPGTGLVQQTLATIQRQSEIVLAAIEPKHIAQAAFGGGTPTEFSTTLAAKNWSFTPTSMAFSEDDRLVVRFQAIDAGGTMTTGSGSLGLAPWFSGVTRSEATI